MKTKVQVDIDCKKILQSRGLGKDRRAAKYLANLVAEKCDKRVPTQTARTPEEEMRIRIAQLEHENYMLRMERDLLKKLNELERRDAYRK